MATTKKKAATTKKVATKKTVTKKAPAAKKVTTKKVTATKKVATKKVTATKKVATKKVVKAAAPKADKPKTARKPNAAFMRPLTPSAELAEVVGAKPLPRTEVVKKIWEYIRKHNLQDPKNKRNINADDKLKAVFGGKKTVSMFEMTKLVSAHLS